MAQLALKNDDYFDAQETAACLSDRFGGKRAEEIIAGAWDHFGDRFALVSSFGSQSAVLLHLAAQVSKDIPVLFLDTGKLFGETKRFRDQLIETLGLTDVRTFLPDADDVKTHDPKGILWSQNTNGCCFIRKVVPLEKALNSFDGWASGRKRYQGADRAELMHFEASDERVKVNPMALWSADDVTRYMKENNLPYHPLVADGFKSIGCMPCTDRVEEGESERAGRWRGKGKTECGIHLSFAENAQLASYNSSEL